MRNSVDVPAEGGGDGSQDFDPLYDDIVVEEPNNNVASSSNQNNIRVGEPSPNYRLGESFYTSHNYFRKDPNSPYEAECLVCAEKQKEMNLSKRKRVMIQTPQFSPKGMQSHLFAVHKELKVQILKQKEAHDEKKKQNQKEKEEQHLARGDSMKQQKLVASGEKKTLAVEPRHDPQMQKRFDKAVVQFAAKTGVSFQALSKGNIEILIKPFFPKSTPKIQGRHKSTISRHTSKEVNNYFRSFNVILRILFQAEDTRRDIYSIVLSAKEDCFSHSFTSDMWSDRALDSFISLTQHFITNDGDLIKLVPFCEYFGKRKHTGLNIKISLADMLRALGLEDEKYDKNVVLDNAKNNKCAIRLSPSLKGYWCAIHTLQLAIKDTMKSTVQNVPVITVNKKCKELAKFVRGSEGRNNELKAACKMKNIKYRLPSKQMAVRWNTQEANISSVVRLRPALQYLVFNTNEGWDQDKHSLSVQEFKMGETIVKVLEPAKIASKQWEADSSPTMHLVVREVFNIQGVLKKYEKSTDKYIASFAKELKNNVDKRFPNFATDTLIYSVAHMLDPEYKGAILQVIDDDYNVYDKAKEEIFRLGSRQNTELPNENETAIVVRTELEEISEDDLTPAQKLLSQKRRHRNPSAQDVTVAMPGGGGGEPSSIRKEFGEYEEMTDMGDTKDILAWWVRNKKRFPLLFQVVRMVLAIPASSATSERVFSKGTKVSSLIGKKYLFYLL